MLVVALSPLVTVCSNALVLCVNVSPSSCLLLESEKAKNEGSVRGVVYIPNTGMGTHIPDAGRVDLAGLLD